MFTKRSCFDLCALTLLSGLALALRLWHLDTKEFWYDEAYTGIMVHLPADQLQNLLQFDVHPPVYIFALRMWSDLLGDSDFTIRLFSVLAGVLLVVASYLLVSSLEISQKYRSTKFLIPLIIAVNPFFVEYSKEARSYSLVALIFSGLFVSYYIASKSLRFNLKWFITALLIIVAFLTHYLIAVGLCCLFVFDFFFTNHTALPLKDFISKKIVLYFCIAVVIIPILFFYLPTVITQYKNAPVMWWIPIADLARMPTTVYIFLLGVKPNTLGVPQPLEYGAYFSAANIGVGLVLLFTVLITRALTMVKNNKHKKELQLLLFCSVVPIGVVMMSQLVGNRLFLERYLTPYAFIFVVLFGVLLFSFKRTLTYALCGVYIIASIGLIGRAENQRVGYTQLSHKLASITDQQVLLIMPDPISFTVAKYYFGQQANVSVKVYSPKEDLADWEIIERGEILRDYSPLKGKARIWVYLNDTKPDIWYRQKSTVDTLYVYSSVFI